MLPGFLLLLVGVALAAAASLLMADGAEKSPASGRGRTVPDDGDAVRGLVVASLAVAAATTGGAWLSTGELSIRGLGPFLLAVLAVLVPVGVAARATPHRAGRRRGTDPSGDG